jgi:hypothetical protein
LAAGFDGLPAPPTGLLGRAASGQSSNKDFEETAEGAIPRELGRAPGDGTRAATRRAARRTHTHLQRGVWRAWAWRAPRFCACAA